MPADGGQSRAEGIVDALLRRVRAQLSDVEPAYFDGWASRHYAVLVELVEAEIVPLLPGGRRPGPVTSYQGPVTSPDGGPLTDPGERAAANLAAMNLLARVRWGTPDERSDLDRVTSADRRVIGAYSGWGGIGLKRYAARFPAGFPVPEARGLVHEYYTPTRVWGSIVDELVGPTVDTLPRGEDGKLHALEPSAGIGRALAVTEGWGLSWTALEASAVSSRLLRVLYPKAEVIEGYAETFLASSLTRRFGLVLANPPYGPRGEGVELDAKAYATKQAYIYFVMRTAERLQRGGIGVYIIPTGLMSSRTSLFAKHRTALLQRAHLLGAFRLPSVPPPGGTVADVAYDQFVVDVVVVEGRGGLADAPPNEDLGIIEGSYYEAHPTHVLGRVLKDPNASDDADAPPVGPKIRRGMQIEGRFTGFPAWTQRPFVDVPVRAFSEKGKARGGLTRAALSGALPDEAPERLHHAVGLGTRVDRYLAAVAKGAQTEGAGRSELARDLAAWVASHGAPARDDGLRTLAAAGNVAAQRFLAVFQGTALHPAITTAGPTPTYSGPRNLAELADWTFRQSGGLPVLIGSGPVLPGDGKRVMDMAAAGASLDAVSRAAGMGGVSPARVWSELWPLGWRVDGDERYTSGIDGLRIEPREHYLTGFLWPKFGRAGKLTGPRAKEQVAELRAAIGWVGGSVLLKQTAPNQPWIPLTILQKFASEAKLTITVDGKARTVPAVEGWPTRATLVRDDGIVSFDGVPYARLENTKDARAGTGASQHTLCFLGYLNTDNQLWKPPIQKRLNAEGNEVQVPVDETRREQERDWNAAWMQWLQENDRIVEQLEEAYNRRLRGYVPPEWSQEPIEVARWNETIRLHPYQNGGARKLLANRCGLLAFDVGLGKTYTGMKTLARARQEGWAKRPVVVVPPTICWKWWRDFQRCLPDYRVVVIGSDRKLATTGKRKGKWVAINDTPDSRAAKWSAFQAGAYDVAIVTYSALARQQIDRDFVTAYVAKTVAIRRSIALALEQEDAAEAVEGGKKPKKGGGKRSERGEADIAERARAWVGDKLAPPKGWAYDTGIDWHQLGIDFMMVDEAQNFKNLFFSQREGAADRAAAKRAWALDFRAASVRAHSGGAGIVLLSATPMKNAATEFYNLLHLVNPAVWEQVGLADPESFISQFALIQERTVTQGDGSQAKAQVVTGFNHIEALKGVVFRWAEFKNAVQVGLKLPDVKRTQHIVRASEEQVDKFGELFAELADIQESMKRIAHMKDAKGDAIRRVLRLKRQGVNARLYLTALHPGLTKGSNLPEAGPKLVECVKAIVATRPETCSPSEDGEPWCLSCGHLVFVENPLVHRHLRTLLVREGLDPARIAILNADEAPDLEQRQQIAEGFNGVGSPTDEEHSAPRYDVVIANAVAYEGIDLQRRTCAVHHLDVPWEPATLQQRNGRAVRQGAKFPDIGIHFYFVAGSSEQHRLDKIERKRGIMLALYDEGDLATNSTMADEVDADDDIADSFLNFAPPALREKLVAAAAEEKADQKREQEAKARKGANAVVREAIQARRRWLRVDKTQMGSDQQRSSLEMEYRNLERRLGGYPAALWEGPWHRLAQAALEAGEAWVPEVGYPLVAHAFLRVGVRTEEGTVRPLYPRVVGPDPSAMPWDVLVTEATVEGAHGVNVIARGHPEVAALPADIEIIEASDRIEPVPSEWFARFGDYVPFYGDVRYWKGDRWRQHGETWGAYLWARIRPKLANPSQAGGPLPVRSGGGLRVVAQWDRVDPADLFAPTPAGFAELVKLARVQKEVTHRQLAAAVKAWWGWDLATGTVGADLKATDGP